jgi:hypothetical protein
LSQQNKTKKSDDDDGLIVGMSKKEDSRMNPGVLVSK